MAKISVVVPIYKVEKYLHRCVDSILAQTFRDFELILVDDGSPDRCPSICDEYKEKDERVHVIHKENGGLSSARNAGIDYVFSKNKSEWITFIDSDDWINEKYLEILYESAVRKGVSVSVCGYKRVKENVVVEEKEISKIKILFPEKLWVEKRENATVAWGKLYKTELFSDVRYPKGKIHEDEYTTYKVLFKTRQIAYLEEPLYYYSVNDESITQVKWSQKRLNALDAIKEQIIFFRENKYKKAYKRSITALGYKIYTSIEGAKKSQIDNENEKIIKNLIQELRGFLSKNSRYFPVWKFANGYIIAFPEKKKRIERLMAIKDFLRKFLRKKPKN